MRRVVGRWWIGVLAGAACGIGAAPLVQAAPDTTEPAPVEDPLIDEGTVTGADTGDTVPVTLPLVPLPIGCTPPASPHIVFVGEVIDRDARSIRYRIESIRAGRPDPFNADDRIDVRYGLDVQYLADGERYLVSAVVDPDLGILTSRVTAPVEHFGGDEVIGVSESDVDCPPTENPITTLHLDGSEIEAGVLTPFFDAKVRILGAVLVPAGFAIAAIFALASFRLSVSGVYRSVTGTRQRSA